MKNIKTIIISVMFLLPLFSFTLHKFYVSIYKVEQNVQKKRLEITSRIFIDDLNKVLTKHSGQRTQVGENTQTQVDIVFLKNYMAEKIKINVNGKYQKLIYKSNEVLGDQLITYFVIPNITKIKTFSIENTALLELDKQQQNIVNIKLKNQKQSLILTANNSKGMLKL